MWEEFEGSRPSKSDSDKNARQTRALASACILQTRARGRLAISKHAGIESALETVRKEAGHIDS